jgi:serine/threonine protein phosphatase PrpC
MARTIGDAEAGDVVCAEPEVCQVTLPATGGRLLIGSDGLWDAVHPKTAAHHVRDMSVAEAAPKLLALAIKADRLKDDVTGGALRGQERGFLPYMRAVVRARLLQCPQGAGSTVPGRTRA